MSTYISTRGQGKPKKFSDVMLSGIAPDGGLYVPEQWPTIKKDDWEIWRGASYDELAIEIIRPFIGDDIDKDVLSTIIRDTYNKNVFDHEEITPVVKIGKNTWLLELFHGPTLSFKDYALQLLGRLFDYVLEKEKKRLAIVGATSGDTGSAAIEACKHCKNIDLFILHPHDRISAVQRKQMTTVDSPNVHNIAIEGTFDDCQTLVKDIFADIDMQEKLSLSAINSINWARIMAQTVYYIYAALNVESTKKDPVSFTVPTGNFGNVYAGWIAKKMGAPIDRLVIGTNSNDIITRFFETGEMAQEGVTPTLSPSMDIQISSNFERYLFDLLERDSDRLTTTMEEFKAGKSFSLPDDLARKPQEEFSAHRCTDEKTLAIIKNFYEEKNIMLDPHTAVGMNAAARVMENDPDMNMIVISTAHPAKFPDAVKKATGEEPDVPARLQEVMDKAEHFTPLPNNLDRIKNFVLDHART